MRPSKKMRGMKATSKPSTKPAVREEDFAAVHPSLATTPPAEGTTPKKPTYEMRMRQLAPIVRLKKKLEATSKRFSNIASEVKRWQNALELGEQAKTVEASLAAMLHAVTTMPTEFSPARQKRGNPRQLTVGGKVALRGSVAARYAGIVEPEVALEVVAITRAHVSVRTAAGALVVLARAHVVRAPLPVAGVVALGGEMADTPAVSPFRETLDSPESRL